MAGLNKSTIAHKIMQSPNYVGHITLGDAVKKHRSKKYMFILKSIHITNTNDEYVHFQYVWKTIHKYKNDGLTTNKYGQFVPIKERYAYMYLDLYCYRDIVKIGDDDGIISQDFSSVIEAIIFYKTRLSPHEMNALEDAIQDLGIHDNRLTDVVNLPGLTNLFPRFLKKKRSVKRRSIKKSMKRSVKRQSVKKSMK